MVCKITKYQIFLFTFLCYTSIHALRTSYSYAKSDISKHIKTQSKYMGIVDALMLSFLGLGHFLHAVYPIKKPVRSLWIGMVVCAINFELIPLSLNVQALSNIYILAIFMSINGYLQSYTWPNLLMIINQKFNSKQNSALLGCFWSANTNVGNIIGFGVFQILNNSSNSNYWQYGMTVCAIYTLVNGVYVGGRFQELNVDSVEKGKCENTRKSIKRQSLSIENHVRNSRSMGYEGMANSRSTISQDLLDDLDRNSDVESIQPNPLDNVPEDSQKSKKLSVIEVFKDPNVLLLTITFALAKSVIYGIMLWLPQFFKIKGLSQYSAQIPIAYDTAAIFGSIIIGYLFKKIDNKGFLMIPFMIILFICFFVLKSGFQAIAGYFVIIAVVGFSLGGIFNTLSGLVVIQLTKLIPDNLKTSSLGFYSALTMAVGNITTAITQILIGFVIVKENPEGIFIVFMVYAAVCLACLIGIAVLTFKQKIQKNQQEKIPGKAKDTIISVSDEQDNPTIVNNRELCERITQNILYSFILIQFSIHLLYWKPAYQLLQRMEKKEQQPSCYFFILNFQSNKKQY